MTEETREEGVKKEKKVLREAPEGPREEKARPTPHEIRTAKKAQLVAWCEELGLDTEGRVDELRKRLLARMEEEAEERPPQEERVEAEEAEARPAGERKEEAAEKEEEAKAVYQPKMKPKLDPAIRRLLALRAAKSAARPTFHRQEWFRYKRLRDVWRKPQGGQSKLRRHFGYRWNIPSIGYRGPREVRGLHPSGFQEVLVHNVRQLEGLDPTKQAVRVAHGVGTRKRELIEKACDEKGLRVLNRMVTS